MSTIIEADETGALHLPPALLPNAAPGQRYAVETGRDRVVVSNVEAAPAFWQTASPEERATDLQRWAASHRDGPGLPDSAVGRDPIYD